MNTTAIGSRLKWETSKLNLPTNFFEPYGCAAEINGILHVGWVDRMFQLKKGAWRGGDHSLGIPIGSVFECEEKGYVMEGGGHVVEKCKSIYEWKSEAKDLELLTKIPDEYQLTDRTVIGHKKYIFLVGGWQSDRVDCFDLEKGKWEPIKKMKNQRCEGALAVIDDKLFVGGGASSNSVECFLMKEQKWIDIKPTTKKLCQFSSWNGKLVATGGGDSSNCVEMYDEVSGEWLPLPSMNKGRMGHGACATKDNQLIVVGGITTSTSVEWLKM